MAKTNPALLITDNDQGSKTETPTALDHFGDAIDVHEFFNKLGFSAFK
jgi:hypothetical protein